MLVLTPNYYKPRMDSAALVAHYRTVAAGVKQPVLIYYIPQFTGLEVDAATIVRLSRLPNVVGLKDSAGKLDFVRAVLRKVRPGFRVLVGAASIFYDALCVGAVGGVLGLANFAPSLCVGLYEAFLHGRSKEAHDLQQRLLPLAQKIAVPYGVAGDQGRARPVRLPRRNPAASFAARFRPSERNRLRQPSAKPMPG